MQQERLQLKEVIGYQQESTITLEEPQESLIDQLHPSVQGVRGAKNFKRTHNSNQ